MKFIKGFKDFDKVSEELKYHIDNGLGLDDTVFRLGSDAHAKLFEEVFRESLVIELAWEEKIDYKIYCAMLPAEYWKQLISRTTNNRWQTFPWQKHNKIFLQIK